MTVLANGMAALAAIYCANFLFTTREDHIIGPRMYPRLAGCMLFALIIFWASSINSAIFKEITTLVFFAHLLLLLSFVFLRQEWKARAKTSRLNRCVLAALVNVVFLIPTLFGGRS